MYRKKSAQQLKSSTIMTEQSRDASIRKLSFCDRTSQDNKINTNMSIDVSRKTSSCVSTSASKSSLAELENLEKKAIKVFYDKKPQETFRILAVCDELADKVDSTEHKVYIQYLYTEFYFKLKKNDQSMRSYQKAKNLFKNCSPNKQHKLSNYMVNLQCLYLSLLYQIGAYSRVLELSDHVIGQLQAGTPQWLQTNSTKAKALVQLGIYNKAFQNITLILQYVTKDSDRIKYSLKLAECMEKMEKERDAVEVLQQIIQNFPQHEMLSSVYAHLGQLYQNLGDIIRSIYNYERAKDSYQNTNHQDFQECCRILAKLYSFVGDDEKCLENCEYIINNQSSAEDILVVAAAQSRLGAVNDAFQCYTRALERQTSEALRLKIYLQLLDLIGQTDAADLENQFIEEANRNRSRESVLALGDYANSLRKKGEHQRAEYFYRQAITQATAGKFSEFLFAIFYNIGDMLEELSRLEESIAFYNKALRLNIDHELNNTIRERLANLKSACY